MTADGGIRFGNYVLLRRLARGGMAEVFLAQQRGPEGFDRRVAVKRILPHLADSLDFVRMFLGEAKLAAQLSHPNIVHIYEFGKVDHDYFIAMEYIEGVHAGQLFKHGERERLTPALVARIGADAAAALHYAHELRAASGKPLGLVHRDVSPANLMISFDGVVKLCDFGIAKAAEVTEQRTNPGQVKGKYAYMSPEQTIAAMLDGRSDVFSLGIVLWELLVGRTIVPRGDALVAMRAIRDGKLQPLAEAAPGVPPALADAVTWALAKRREDRATAAELATALEAFIKSSPELATPMQVGAWIRPRFPRDRSTGPRTALRDDGSAGPGTVAAPGTTDGTVGVPLTPDPDRPTSRDETSETSALPVDSDANVETLIVDTRARPPAMRPTIIVADSAVGESAVDTTKRDQAPAGATATPAPAAAAPAVAPAPMPVEDRFGEAATRLGLGEPSTAMRAAMTARPSVRPIGATLRDAAPPPQAQLRSGVRPRLATHGVRSVDARARNAPVMTGTEAVARLRRPVPRRTALLGLGAIGFGTFVIALVVCSPKTTALTRGGQSDDRVASTGPLDGTAPGAGPGGTQAAPGRPNGANGPANPSTGATSGATGGPNGAGANPNGPGGANPNGAASPGGAPNPNGANPGAPNPNGANPGAPNPNGANPGGANPNGANPGGANPNGASLGAPNPNGANLGAPNPNGAASPGGAPNPNGANPGAPTASGANPGAPAASGANPGAPNPNGAASPGGAPTANGANGGTPASATRGMRLYKVDTRPSGGIVRIGNLRRTAPAEFVLAPGRYTVVAELDGWLSETRAIEIVEGADLVQDIPFSDRRGAGRAPPPSAPTGTLTVETTPPSDVYIGTRKLGQAPFTDREVPAGTYWLTFKHPARPPVRKQVTITPGKLTRLPAFSLPPS